ncbi:MAG: RNA polymerase sigma factor [Bacteroidetes bacterium]|nr:MAG: RNA polymerase sigma factor [Bacteroidota bacterium]
MNWTTFHQQIFPIRDKLYRFALRITGSVHEAEDVVQEVLERVWKTPAEQSSTVQNWEAWCMTITRNRSLDKARSMVKRRTATLDGEAERQSDGVDPGQLAESRDLIGMVRQMMQTLPEKQRLVMHLRDIEELSYEEIAEVLDISLDQVKVNLHRARKSIRNELLQSDAFANVNA